MPHSPTTSLDLRIEALKAKPSGGLAIASVRLTGEELVTWENLLSVHPKISATELLKEAIKLRYLADLCAADGSGLFLRQPSTGHLLEVLSLLGYSRASLGQEDAHQEKPMAAPKVVTSKTRKSNGDQRQKAVKKSPTGRDRQTPAMT
jgi:hypothetical protein